MNADQFIEIVRIAAFQRAVEGTIEELRSPPLKPRLPRLIEMSQHFNALNRDDQAKVEMAIENAAHAAVFNLLCILDGVQAIEDSDEKGRLELRYVKGDTSMLLTGERGQEMLHDIFNREIPRSMQ
ncbi:MAG: hypothetical protein AAB676_02140 [Verrucomicrobiota bacterium]